MVTPDEAVVLAGISARAIYRRIETGKAHYTESGDGFLLVCLESLST
jgi:hypothetical protein